MIKDTINIVDSSTFDADINNNVAVIMIKAPWCSSCNSIYPQYVELSTEMKDVFFGVMEADLNKDFCFDVLGIRSLPTFLIYKKGEKKDFIVGPRPKSALKEAIEKED